MVRFRCRSTFAQSLPRFIFANPSRASLWRSVIRGTFSIACLVMFSHLLTALQTVVFDTERFNSDRIWFKEDVLLETVLRIFRSSRVVIFHGCPQSVLYLTTWGLSRNLRMDQGDLSICLEMARVRSPPSWWAFSSEESRWPRAMLTVRFRNAFATHAYLYKYLQTRNFLSFVKNCSLSQGDLIIMKRCKNR